MYIDKVVSEQQFICAVFILTSSQVTHFLYQSAETLHTVSDPLPFIAGASDLTASVNSPRPSGQPATLFSNAQIRGEVAIQLLTCSQDIIEGFDFAREIIQVST